MAAVNGQRRYSAMDASFTEVHLCQTCGVEYKSQSGLRRHNISKHSDKQPHKCCGKTFVEKSTDLADCRSYHAKDRINCNDCSAEFTTKSSLNRHRLRSHEHPGGKTYKCCQCDLSFKRRDELFDHGKGVHQKERRYTCSVCEKKYIWRASLHRHVTTSHK